VCLCVRRATNFLSFLLEPFPYPLSLEQRTVEYDSQSILTSRGEVGTIGKDDISGLKSHRRVHKVLVDPCILRTTTTHFSALGFIVKFCVPPMDDSKYLQSRIYKYTIKGRCIRSITAYDNSENVPGRSSIPVHVPKSHSLLAITHALPTPLPTVQRIKVIGVNS
jgi:hypothetical protein